MNIIGLFLFVCFPYCVFLLVKLFVACLQAVADLLSNKIRQKKMRRQKEFEVVDAFKSLLCYVFF